MTHRWELDALRGLMLVLMTVTHLPTRFSDPLGQPFGFVSAAEGFVMLSAYMAGVVYTERERRLGGDEMRGAFLKRAFKIWLCQAALLLFAFTAITLIGAIENEDAVNNLLSFYRERPLVGLLTGLLLIYSPPLLDILPMYVLFMLASPLLLLHGLRQGWLLIMAASVAFWLAAQWEVGRWFYEFIVAPAKIPVPLRQTGAFDIFAWQFLWVFGLWLGSSHAAGAEGARAVFPRWMVVVALLVAALAFFWRYAVGQSPFPHHPGLNLLFDKWQLAPLRLIDFFALMVLVMHFGSWLKTHLPRSAFLETLGAAALPVFCAHLVVVLLVLATMGGIDRQAAATRERLKARRARRAGAVAAGVSR